LQLLGERRKIYVRTDVGKLGGKRAKVEFIQEAAEIRVFVRRG
jgi:hypothetical protein